MMEKTLDKYKNSICITDEGIDIFHYYPSEYVTWIKPKSIYFPLMYSSTLNNLLMLYHKYGNE